MFASSLVRSGPSLKSIGVFLLLASIVLVRTRPTHFTHVTRLFPGPAPLDLMDEPPEFEIIRRNHPPTSNTEFFDGRLFSTTRSTVTGGLSSIGLLGMVFDIRNDTQRAADQRAFDEARRRTVPGLPTIGRPIIPAGLLPPRNESGPSHTNRAADEIFAAR